MTNGSRKLLLADDSHTIQKVVSLTFSDEGFEVVAVGDGEAALREIESGAPDIILADVFMPKLDGYEVCARVKADARFRHVPVLLLVGTFEPFDEAEARRVGADDFLTKPFQSIRDLVNKVGGLLSGPTRQETESISDWSRDEVPETRRAAKDNGVSLAPHTSPSFADFADDDAMIKATPAETPGDERYSSLTASASAPPDAGETTAHFGRRAEPTFEQQTVASPTATDADTLLDLGDVEVPAIAAEDDYFILDLSGETAADPTPAAAPVKTETVAATREPAKLGVVAGDGASQSAAPSAPPAIPAEEEPPRGSFSRDADGGRGISAPEDSYRTAPLSDVGGASGTREIRANQLTPEAIELIARRVVELLSEKVVREVAREVVPEVAERIIKRQLDEDKRRSL